MLKKKLVVLLMLTMFLLVSCTQTSNDFTIEKAKNLEESFDSIVFHQKMVGETNKVENHNTKKELINELMKVSSEKVASEFVNNFYEEKEGNLYIVPTETPPQIDFEKDYQFRQIDENTYELTQEGENQLYGNYNIKVEYKLFDDEWKINDRIFNF